jgi:hypothetical protein
VFIPKEGHFKVIHWGKLLFNIFLWKDKLHLQSSGLLFNAFLRNTKRNLWRVALNGSTEQILKNSNPEIIKILLLNPSVELKIHFCSSKHSFFDEI